MKDGAIYTNPTYGVSDVTLQVDLVVGIGMINMEVEGAVSMSGSPLVTTELGKLSQVVLEGSSASRINGGQH